MSDGLPKPAVVAHRYWEYSQATTSPVALITRRLLIAAITLIQGTLCFENPLDCLAVISDDVQVDGIDVSQTCSTRHKQRLGTL